MLLQRQWTLAVGAVHRPLSAVRRPPSPEAAGSWHSGLLLAQWTALGTVDWLSSC
jgi:hypothetical protein